MKLAGPVIYTDVTTNSLGNFELRIPVDGDVCSVLRVGTTIPVRRRWHVRDLHDRLRAVVQPAHVGHRSHREVGRGTVRQVDRSDARRLHQDPEQVGDVRSRVEEERPHGQRRRAARRLGEAATCPRARRSRSCASGDAHAGHLHRHPGHRRQGRRHRHALRPPRQAARDDRLARGPRPVDARCSRATSSTAAAAPTTATRSSRRSPRSTPLRKRQARRTRAASS